MRNLKRALSLAMASVMLLGMMVVGTSAKGLDDFSDSAEVVNKDAVAVTSEIGIFDGYDDGEFKPENVVTRAEMAVIICKMLYGADVKVEQFTETQVFTDVPAWAEGYVNLCASLGIVAGVGDNKFDPYATVTTAQAAMMLTKALGYFQSARDFGDNWMLAATAKATELGLYGDLKLSAVAGLTRDNVAEMVFNALTKAVPVQYNELLGVYYNENKGIMYSLTFYYTDTLGYKNFDLVYRSNETTSYGRPGTTWGTGSYRGNSATTEGNDAYGLNEDGSLKPNMVKMLAADEIITVADTPDYIYTEATKQKTVYKDLGKGVADKNTDYEWTYFVDGDEVDGVKPENKDGNYAYTKTGAETEIYVDSVNEEVTVVVINYYLAQVNKVKSDYSLLNVFNYDGAKLDSNKFTTTDFDEDDYVIVTIDCADHFAEGKDVEAFIATVAEPETAQGVVTLVNKDKDDSTSYLKMDDVKYTYSANNYGDVADGETQHPALKDEYKLFLDPNGYMVGFQATADSTKQYLYVEKAHLALNLQANVVLADGTAQTITAKDTVKGDVDENDDPVALTEETAEALAGHAYAYTVNDKGVYTLERLDCSEENPDSDSANHVEGDILNDEPYIYGEDNKYLVDLDTVFVDVKDETAYVGYEAVPNYEDAEFIIVGEGRVKDIVFIESGNKYDEDATLFYVSDYKDFDTVKDGDFYYMFKSAYVDGVQETIYVERDEARDEITANGLYKVKRTTANGEYVTMVEPVELKSEEVTAMGNGSFWITDANENDVKYTFDAETTWVYVDEDGDVSVGNKKDIIVHDDNWEPEDGMTYVTVVKNDKRYAQLVYIVALPEVEITEDPEAIEGIVVIVDGYDILMNANGKGVEAQVEAIKAALADKGYTSVEITLDGQNEINPAIKADKNGVTYNFTLKSNDPEDAGVDTVIAATQDELEEAIAEGTETIYLAEGTYEGTTITNDVEIIGLGDVVLKGADATIGQEAALYINGASNVTVKNVTIKDSYWGIITGYAGTPELDITDCTFVNCETAIYVCAANGGVIADCTFTNCGSTVVATETLAGELTIKDFTFKNTDKTVHANDATIENIVTEYPVKNWSEVEA